MLFSWIADIVVLVIKKERQKEHILFKKVCIFANSKGATDSVVNNVKIRNRVVYAGYQTISITSSVSAN